MWNWLGVKTPEQPEKQQSEIQYKEGEKDCREATEPDKENSDKSSENIKNVASNVGSKIINNEE